MLFHTMCDYCSSHAGVAGMPPVSQTERTFVWMLITEITAVCGGGPSVAFMLDAWTSISDQIGAQIAAGKAINTGGVQEEGAAILRALTTSVDMLGVEQVRSHRGIQLCSSASDLLHCHATLHTTHEACVIE